MSPIERCGAHDGVCDNIAEVKARIHDNEKECVRLSESFLKNKTFWIIMPLVFAVIGWIVVTTGTQHQENYTILTEIKTMQKVQAMEIKHMTSDLADVKSCIKRYHEQQ